MLSQQVEIILLLSDTSELFRTRFEGLFWQILQEPRQRCCLYDGHPKYLS